MNLHQIALNLITYDCGLGFNSKLFRHIQNREYFDKPNGGLWASPIKCEWGWIDWCQSEEFSVNLAESFTFRFSGLTLVIGCLDHLLELPFLEPLAGTRIRYPDFEAIAGHGVQGIYLTLNGMEETRLTHPGLYGWDCECILIMDPTTILSDEKGLIT